MASAERAWAAHLLPVRLLRLRITGGSMSPTLREGDWTLFRYCPGGMTKRALERAMGKVVLVQRVAAPELLTVKRLNKVLDTGYWVEGDNKEASTDSRQYLTLAREEIVGVFVLRYRRGSAREITE